MTDTTGDELRAARLRDPKTAIEAVAASWASIDGKLETFGADRQGKMKPEAGHFEGYLEDAAELIARLEKRGYTVQALASPAPAVPEGYVLVPKQPTVAMMQAGVIAWREKVPSQVYAEPLAEACYQAMIEKAATLPSQDRCAKCGGSHPARDDCSGPRRPSSPSKYIPVG